MSYLKYISICRFRNLKIGNLKEKIEIPNFQVTNFQFSSYKNDTRKSKIEKKNSVQHLEYCLRLIYYKFGHFRSWEPKKIG